MNTTLTIPGERIDELTSFAARLLEASGVAEDDAAMTASMFVENNLSGIDSHGVRLLPVCVERLAAGGINPAPAITTVAETAATARIDGDNGLGQVVASHGMRLAIEKAESAGSGFVVCVNTNNIGALGRYTEMASSAGKAGFALGSTVPSMFATGGRKRVVANAPLSISYPGRNGGYLLDICLGEVAWNKIYMRRDAGEPLPSGWAVDSNGAPTTQPEAAANGGSVHPIGGHKGYGLALAIELLTSVLGGGPMTDGIHGLFDDPSVGEGITVAVAAIDIAALLPDARLDDRVDALFRFVKDSPSIDGGSEVRIPGEYRRDTRERRSRRGLTIPEETAGALDSIGRRLGVDFPFPTDIREAGGDE